MDELFKPIKFLYFLIILFFISGSVCAASLRVIIAANTNDISIGNAVSGNVDNVRYFFKDVARVVKMKYAETAIVDENFTCDGIDKAIKSIRTGRNDVIIFFYSGHGFREQSDTSKFPRFLCGAQGQESSTSGLQDASKLLMKTNARMIILIADTCNTIISEPNQQRSVLVTGKRKSSPKTGLKNLFFNYRGLLEISSSSPDQFSWYYSDGGFFTDQLIGSLRASTRYGKAVTWEEVLVDVSKVIKINPSFGNDAVVLTQQPQFDMTKVTKIN